VYRIRSARKQEGFTLVELMVVLAIMALMAAANVPNYINQINEKRANKTVVDTQAILDAARIYRTETGTWPGAPTCATATAVLRATTPPMLAGVKDTNAYNSNFSTTCTSKTFAVEQNLIKGWDAVVVNTLPGAELINAGASQVRSSIGIPGSESGLDSKLSRVYTGDDQMNRMETNLLLGNHNISEINNVSATSANVSGDIRAGTATVEGRATFNELIQIKTAQTEGQSCASNNLVSRNGSGIVLYCVNGVWARPVTWYPGSVSGGGGCGSFPSGSMAFDSSGRLFVCK
jgi:prepilin-type N-terminal cleavage/methylation domain-containing protein